MTAPVAAPSAERLDAAVSLIVERLAPDQIILFGSGARGQMAPSSDLDLLVIKGEDGIRSTRHERWQCPDNGDQLDVVVMSRAAAERHRLSASYVQGAALDEGQTVYLRDGVAPTATGPTYTWNGAEMVKTTQFEPDHAAELLETAEAKWEDANRTRRPLEKCEYLQRTIELGLKALITASGRRVEHRHELNRLWEQAEAADERIGATRDPEQIKKLDQYAGAWRYDTPADDPAETWRENRTTGEDVLNHARQRVPQLIEQTRQTLASRSREPGAGTIGGETPPDPATAPEPAQGSAARRADGRDRGRGRTP